MLGMSRILALLITIAAVSRGGTLVLKRAWIDQFKDRATIDATFTIDHAHPRPNPGAQDGDMHVAGRAPKEIGLPMVAEIMNAIAPTEKAAVDLVHETEKKNGAIPVTGAWRLWFEHPPSTGSQIQFNAVPMAANTNPDHCFEIHPVTKAGPNDLTGSFKHIPGFPPKDAKTAFTSYEKLSVSLQANDSAVTLTSTKSGFNYVLFTLHGKGATTNLKDGGIAVMADILPADGDTDETLAQSIRMIFVPGTDPFKKVTGGLGGDQRLKVLGIPRINLNAVSAFVDKTFPKSAGGKKSAAGTAVTRKLPYEIIVVALE